MKLFLACHAILMMVNYCDNRHSRSGRRQVGEARSIPRSWRRTVWYHCWRQFICLRRAGTGLEAARPCLRVRSGERQVDQEKADGPTVASRRARGIERQDLRLLAALCRRRRGHQRGSPSTTRGSTTRQQIVGRRWRPCLRNADHPWLQWSAARSTSSAGP